MFDIDKITYIYCICDDFCKEFNEKVSETAIEAPKSGKEIFRFHLTMDTLALGGMIPAIRVH